jgi:flagellar protein FlgJ
MYDQQLAVSMSREGGGIGLADVLMRQMSKNKPMAPGEAAAASAAKQEAAKAAAQTPVAAGTVATGGPLSRVNGSVRCGLRGRSMRRQARARTATTWR